MSLTFNTVLGSLGLGHGNHAHVQKKTVSQEILTVLEKISAVVLAILSAWTRVQLFVPFFLLGSAVGVHSYFTETRTCKHIHAASSCSGGFLEQVTGVHLPDPLPLAAETAVLVAHLDHLPHVFVPMTAFYTGAGAGKVAAEHCARLYTQTN